MSKMHLLVLGLLYEQPRYAYEFKKVIEERAFDRWAGIQLRSVYAAMESLEKQNYIAGKQELHTNKSMATIYEMTESGRVYLRKLVEKALDERVTITDYWLGISFMFGTTLQFVINTLSRRLEDIRKEIDFASGWVTICGSADCHIPCNYQHLIKMNFENVKTAYKEMTDLLNDLKEGKNADYFVPEN